MRWPTFLWQCLQALFESEAEFCFQTLKANLVPYLAGSPGVGKSAVAHQLAKKFNLKLIDIRLSQEDPTVLN